MSARIFIVEDNPMIQNLLCKLLNKISNFHVCGIASTAQEALALLSVIEVDLLLIDVSLPGISGIDFVSMLQSQQPQLLCLMLSGYQEPAYVKDALAAGARGYVVKGAFYELAGAIRQVLAGEIYLSKQVRNGVLPISEYRNVATC